MAGRRASRLLTDAQIDEMARLRERGWGCKRIAEHFLARDGVRVSAGAINWQCMKAGADVPVRLRGTFHTNLQAYRRGSHMVRPYSAEEDALLLQLDNQALPLSQIARRLGRKTNSVKGRMLTLARHAARAEERESA